jgi:hypothetical protein
MVPSRMVRLYLSLPWASMEEGLHLKSQFERVSHVLSTRVCLRIISPLSLLLLSPLANAQKSLIAATEKG